MKTFKQFLLEAGEDMIAKAEMSNSSKQDRTVNARKSDLEIIQTKKQELEDLAKSPDPLDRQILNLRKQLAQLTQRKKDKAERENK